MEKHEKFPDVSYRSDAKNWQPWASLYYKDGLFLTAQYSVPVVVSVSALVIVNAMYARMSRGVSGNVNAV